MVSTQIKMNTSTSISKMSTTFVSVVINSKRFGTILLIFTLLSSRQLGKSAFIKYHYRDGINKIKYQNILIDKNILSLKDQDILNNVYTCVMHYFCILM